MNPRNTSFIACAAVLAAGGIYALGSQPGSVISGNYSNVGAMGTSSGYVADVHNNTFVKDGDWPQQAQDVSDTAGASSATGSGSERLRTQVVQQGGLTMTLTAI